MVEDKDNQSRTQKLIEHITNQIDANVDLTTTEGRKADFVEFCKNNPELEISRPLYIQALEKVLDAKNINRMAYGLKKQIPKFDRPSTPNDMKVTVKPVPAPSPKPQIKKEETGEIAPAIKQEKSTNTEIQKELTDINFKFTEANVSATVSGFYAFLRWAFPFFDELDESEKKDLGDLWLPAFEIYVKGKYAVIGIPLFATAGILRGKVNEKKRKEWQEKRKGKKSQEDLT